MKPNSQVHYVQKDVIAPAFGFAYKNHVVVREDLPPLVKDFVTKHELFHMHDSATWGGWIGREVRANVACGVRDPLGLLATVLASCNKERVLFYIDRLKRRG